MPTPYPSVSEQARERPAPPAPIFIDVRAELAAAFLRGEGLEIGPLHQPLKLPPGARATYVDRMSAEDLRREYPELAEWEQADVDVIDDGETLASIEAESQDFIIANHFLEHCENPIGTIETHLSKLRPGGVLFYAVPDKRYTFDFRREPTPLDHMIADYEEGPERSRRQHYEEWVRLVETDEEESRADPAGRRERLEAQRYSIHMHVWTQAEFLRLILACRERLGEAFEIEASARQGIEFIVLVRKNGPAPAPLPAAAPAADAPLSPLRRAAIRVRRAASVLAGRGDAE